MKRLLQLQTYGMKNLENEITIDFANTIIEGGIKKVNNVKGIFGYNGAGKSAIITAVDLYNKIVCSPNHLLQNDTKNNLNKLINFVKNEFFISMVFKYDESSAIKHSIKLSKNEYTNDYFISYECVSISYGRSLNDKYKDIIKKTDNNTVIDNEYKTKRLEYLKQADLNYTSFVQLVTNKQADNIFDNSLTSNVENIIFQLFLNAYSIKVSLLDSDKHNYFLPLKKWFKDENALYNNLNDIDLNDIIIDKNDYPKYVYENKKLEKFIQIFKPDVKEIKLITSEDKNKLRLKKLFVYKDYNIEFEFESSGIKQLVKLFSYLIKCANGAITFIDEIDTNINAVYFEKLISFFKNYGQGQLIFTTHNIEAMKALKNQSRAITALGVDNMLDTWTGKGNKSPISDYITGSFPNSPMNIEDFDFINIFQGELEWLN